MPPILWHLELSHYSEKARWALDHKSIAYERRAPLPGLHGMSALVLTRGKQRRLPVIELDGRRIGDSTAIIAALEARQPDPPLYPSDPEERRQALELEDYFDEQVAPRVRRYVWHHTIEDPDAVVAALMPNASPRRKRVMRTMMPVARPIVRRDYGVAEASAAEARGGIVAAVDRIERELQPSGYLVGDSFSVADLAAASLLTPLLAPPGRPYMPASVPPEVLELREELDAREGGAWVAEMYTRHRGAPVALAATAA